MAGFFMNRDLSITGIPKHKGKLINTEFLFYVDYSYIYTITKTK